MASTYSSNLRLEKMATGEKSGTWGDIANTQFELIEDAISGYVSVAMGDANTTLTASNGIADESRNFVVEATGAHTAVRDMIIPAAEKVYLVKNSTTGGYAITVKVSGQTGADVPNGQSRLLFCNGTTTYSAGSFLSTSTDNAFAAAQSITVTSAGTGLEIIAVEDGAAVGPILSLYRNSASPAGSDTIGGLYFYGKDSVATKTLYNGILSLINTATDGAEASSLYFSALSAGTYANRMVMSGASLTPVTSDGMSLGSATLMWSDLFLASGGVVNFNNGDVTITHSANSLAFAGASSGYTFDASGTFTGALLPTVSDTPALGSATAMWADLFLGSGAVINFNNGDVTLTHAANALTFAGATTYTFDGTLAGAVGTFSSTLGVTGAFSGSTGTFSSTLGVTGVLTTTAAVALNGGGVLGNATGDAVTIKGVVVTAAIANTWDAATLAVHTDELLDSLGTETEGALLYHNGTSWVVLAPPVVTSFLKWTGGQVLWSTS